MPQSLSTDILILGGGIAGLWLSARLGREGYATLLVETGDLGGGQTLKSQGIIHGGTKYALHGTLSGASEAIADMPRRWRQALSGDGELDLRDVGLLSDAHYLWSPGSLAGNLTSFLASKAMRGRVEAVRGESLPAPLQNPGFKGKVYRLSELVLDVPSLVRRLGELSAGRLLAGRGLAPWLEAGQPVGIRLDDYQIRAQRILFCAGQGNAELLQAFGLPQPQQQLRPLHMVLVKGPALQPLYAHCLGAGSKPRLTVTSHPNQDGQWVWYLGGDLAEADGVARSAEAQIQTAQQELQRLLPWLDQSNLRWATQRVDRAEPEQSGRSRPDRAFVAEQGRLLVAWPTKLALAPDLTDRVITHLRQAGIRPEQHPPLPALTPPPVGLAPWEALL